MSLHHVRSCTILCLASGTFQMGTSVLIPTCLSQQNAAKSVRNSTVSLSAHKNPAQVQWISIKYLQLSIYIHTCMFDVRKSVHHHTIQIIQPVRCNSFTGLLLEVYVWLNMFRAPLRPSSGEYNCTRSLCFTIGAWRLERCSNGKTRGS